MHSGLNISLSSSSDKYEGDLYERGMRQFEKKNFRTDDEYRAQCVIKLARLNKYNQIRKLHFQLKKCHLIETDKYGYTALYYACKNSNFRMVELFVEKGGEILQECHNKESALDIARRKGDSQVIEFLKRNLEMKSPRKRNFGEKEAENFKKGVKEGVRGIKYAVEEISVRVNMIKQS